MVFVPAVSVSAHYVAVEPLNDVARCEWGGKRDRVGVHALHYGGLGRLRRGDRELVELGLKLGDLGLKLGDCGSGSVSTYCRLGCWLAKGMGLSSCLR